ncbi:MAG: hypothetical protein ACTHMS_08260 [Jatrophihabitans sp.]|uniref:hypothetical protein n=1 Tax=Jatrophihabitans sp. TaxID=1932789 RepID=UPI003F808F6F
MLDGRGTATATLRFIAPGPAGLKTLNDAARRPWQVDGLRSARAAGIDPARTWDVATIAVRRGRGSGGLMAAALYHGLFRATQANDAPWIVMMMDERARRLLHAAGVGTRALPGTRPGDYLGSPNTTPLWGHLPTLAEAQRRDNVEQYRLLNLGVGLDGVTLPIDWVWTRRGADELVARRAALLSGVRLPAVS